MIHEADSIENQMVMDMPFINMGRKHKFILAAQDLLGKLHPDLMGFLREYLPRGESLYQVAAQVVVIAPVNGIAARPSKFNIGCSRRKSYVRFLQFYRILLLELRR